MRERVRLVPLQTYAMQRLALCGASLCEQREHVEVVRDALDLPASTWTLGMPEAQPIFDAVCTHWCLQRSGVNASTQARR